MQWLQAPYEASLVYFEGSTGWAAVSPSSGTITLDQPTTFTIQITPSAADTGFNTVYLALMQTYSNDASAQTLMGTVEISYFNFGPTSVQFGSIVPNGDGTANLTATVGVNFTAPDGIVVPMSGAITSDAANGSTAVALAAPSSTNSQTSYYTFQTAVPMKVSIQPCFCEKPMFVCSNVHFDHYFQAPLAHFQHISASSLASPFCVV